MLKVGITGNIASGKSEVEKILKERNFSVLDTDDVSHIIMQDITVKDEIRKLFQGQDIFENSELSRPKIGEIVFKNEDLRRQLEGILHPRIMIEVEKFFDTCKHNNEKSAFVFVPLLFEANLKKYFDKIALVYSNDNIRLERLINRNNLPVEYAQNRLDAQISQDEKVSLADYVIYNNGSLNELNDNVNEFIKLLFFR